MIILKKLEIRILVAQLIKIETQTNLILSCSLKIHFSMCYGKRHLSLETLLTKEECAKAVDMGNFYRVPADNRDLNYDKYFKHGKERAVMINEFNSNNTEILGVDAVKEKLLSLSYVREELAKLK